VISTMLPRRGLAELRAKFRAVWPLLDCCLNMQQFVSIADAQARIEAWRVDPSIRRTTS
jgi:hypothetical protein